MTQNRSQRCTNSEPGWMNQECGKTASYAGTHPSGHVQYFCTGCKADGYEARGIVNWAPISAPGSRPGDMAAEYAAEHGVDYETALVACNMD